MLRADTEEYHLDWSRGELNLVLDCGNPADDFQEDLSRWTVARVMALCSAPPLAAETDTTETETATDTSDKMLLDTVDFALGSIIDRMSEFDTLPCSYAESLDPASARNSLEQVSPAIESTCPVRAAELVEDSRPPLSVETTQPSPPPVPTTSVDSSPLPLRSTPSVQNASGSGAVYVTEGVRAVYQDLVDVRGLYYIFSRSRMALDAHLSRHGVIVAPNAEVADRRKSLIRHLVMGECFDFAAVRSRFGDGTEPGGCSFVANGSSSANHLSNALLDLVLSSTSHEISNANLKFIALTLGICEDAVTSRKALLDSFHIYRAKVTIPDCRIDLDDINGLKRPALTSFAAMHGLDVSNLSVESMKATLWTHLTDGSCLDQQQYVGCETLVADERAAAGDTFTDADGLLRLQICILERAVSRLSKNGLKQALTVRNISYEEGCPIKGLRKLLKTHISSLKKGKHTPRQLAALQRDKNRNSASEAWPSIVPDTLKAKIVRLFKEETSSSRLAEFICACCAESCLVTTNGDPNRFVRSTAKIDMDLLRYQSAMPESSESQVSELEGESNPTPMEVDVDFEVGEPLPRAPLLPFQSGFLHPYILEPQGVLSVDEQQKIAKVQLCKRCDDSLAHHVLPRLALANDLYLGPIPYELRDLTVVEEAMIARCRAKAWIVQLKETGVHLPNTQRGLKGHIIIYPQHPEDLATVLPPSVDNIITPICVIFVGSSPPTKEWLEEHAKPLMVRKEKVRAALVWLKRHNPLYENVIIDSSAVDSLPENSLLPYHIEHQLPDEKNDALTSRYDVNHTSALEASDKSHTLFDNVVISDVNVSSASTNELRAAALRHVKQKGGGFIQVPHDPLPVNEFCNPDLFPMIYPTLFPYGSGGLEDRSRRRPISLKNQVKHYFSLADRRFQEHYSFLFTAFNIIQRREALLRTKLKVDSSEFERVAADLANIPLEAVHAVTERVSRGDTVTATNENEQRVLRLMKEVRAVTSTVPGSAQSRVEMRNEIRGLMMTHGMPSFYITINPADVFNPLVKFLAGAEIDLDKLLPDQVPNYWEQSILVARNPVVAAKFFNLYMKAFIKTVLGYEPNGSTSLPEGGILGMVKAYYGCVEAQGRGTLHCHMMVWIEGALNPNEIKDRIVKHHDMDFKRRLLDMLDDTISTEIPPDPNPSLAFEFDHFNPCSTRGPSLNDPDYVIKRKKDLHLLAKQCQSHSHTGTCYKYWKGPPDPKECRFDLDESNFVPESSVDMETGELCLRCLDGLVNNFNTTILEAVRCNMDIKFIGSGASAKAILYYITDYITKSQLKTHVAYAALELAVKKLAIACPDEDDKTLRAKRLLQKCAYAMISHQELSSQQVASYLMDYEDHFTSHSYRNLNWPAAEHLIDQQDPSPECKTRSACSMLTEYMNDDESAVDDDEPEADEPTNICDDNLELGDEPESSEVTIDALPSGSIIAKAGQLLDYQMRGMPFSDLNYWDFIAKVDKIRKPKKKSDNKAGPGDTDDPESEVEDPYESDTENFERSTGNTKAEHHIPLLTAHPETETHCLHLRKSSSCRIPVPVGPSSLPRRDRDNVFQRYCRLMLILFKPWRNARHLRKTGQSWSDAFLDFKSSCDGRFIRIMDNMQLLHECKDSRDDHFAQRRSRRRTKGTRISVELSHDSASRSLEDDFFGESIESDILEHITDIEASRSDLTTLQSESALAAVSHAVSGNLFDETPAPDLHHWALESIQDSVVQAVSQTDDDGLEAEWRHAYDQRRDEMKKKNLKPTETGIGNVDDNLMNSSLRARPGTRLPEIVSSISAASETASANSHTTPPALSAPRLRLSSLEDIIDEFTLNAEQSRAFRIICEHTQDRLKPPLQLYLGGAGGTGKSQVIKAVSTFFERRDESRRFRVAAYTGVAARNIGGMTLHSALSLNHRRKGKGESQTRRDLVAMWEGVDYLFIDEISMIGCRFLLDISDALCEATGKNKPFGGLNIILAGDFAQLPPVSETRLYAKLHTTNPPTAPSYGSRSGTPSGQKNVFGQLLWLGFKTVVVLHRPMRQSGPENEAFVSLLERLRAGQCLASDFELLNTRLLSQAICQKDIKSTVWRNAPIIVADNMSKDALNEQAAIAFARSSGQTLHWYYATDSHRSKPIEDNDLKTKLGALHSGKTSHRLGRLPLVIGMPVMITQNYDVEDGAVNGSRGILRRIRYRTDQDGRRHAISCVVEVEDYSGDPLPHLPKQFVPCLQDSVEINFTHPHSTKRCKIHRTQIPLAPAFAITAHKAQGQTLPYVVIDLESSRSCEAAYVMVSRAKSLKGLIVLRPFARKRISSHMNQQLRQELDRLEMLDLETATRYTAHQSEKTCPAEQLQHATSQAQATDYAAPSQAQAVSSHLSEIQANLTVPNPLSSIGIIKSRKRPRKSEQNTSSEPPHARPRLQ